MKNPFQVGVQYGEELADHGWLDATSLNSSNQHREDAAGFAKNQFPQENEEDQATVAAGIMHSWSQRKNWRFYVSGVCVESSGQAIRKDHQMSKDVYHVTVAGINPHDVAEVANEDQMFPESASVAQQILDEQGHIVGGIVEVWVDEHLTPAQEGFLHDMGRAVDVRHVWSSGGE